MKIILFVCSFISYLSSYGQVSKFPISTLQLEFKEKIGLNSTGIAYNPKKKLYYSIIGGNASYPLETFNKKGVSVNQSKATRDMRGLWWNPSNKQLEGNGYQEVGIISFSLSKKSFGIGNNSKILFSGIHQPTDNSCGVYDAQNNEILFYDEDKSVYRYRREDLAFAGIIELNLPVEPKDINFSSMIYTGISKHEIGLFHYEARKVYLFDIASGGFTQTIQLPYDSPNPDVFNFGFANGYIWLFDTKQKIWLGYKID